MHPKRVSYEARTPPKTFTNFLISSFHLRVLAIEIGIKEYNEIVTMHKLAAEQCAQQAAEVQ